ncbi:hypothetical protein SLEP1_g29093 [Rubroshorea leprosula]|uniref:Uncharacterized protein n=1 Tax=Rubroshorea leprosula TaxID=152421 RepID=A0AAV5JVT7_9ROSI|nr:hypothetical protein SLEP1_g29093 [Rubroshorea leprosula]
MHSRKQTLSTEPSAPGDTTMTCFQLLNWYINHPRTSVTASSLLVTALNEGRDVIMDGTLSWEPFVEQTIAMARNVHRERYRMEVGYKVAKDGTITENNWEQVEEDDQEEKENGEIYSQQETLQSRAGWSCMRSLFCRRPGNKESNISEKSSEGEFPIEIPQEVWC